VLDDLLDGIIDRESALCIYGVVIDGDEVDARATDHLRRKRLQ
jgi:hypothetical protein